MTIYEALKKADCDIDNWQSTLYVKVTTKSREILEQFGKLNNAQVFRSRTDNKLWYDIFGAYDPFWNKKGIKPQQK